MRDLPLVLRKDGGEEGSDMSLTKPEWLQSKTHVVVIPETGVNDRSVELNRPPK
jgi:hypothetical protein